MKSLEASAKINLALVVGPLRADGKHEVVTLYERLSLADIVRVEPVGGEIIVEGYPDDTIVGDGLRMLAEQAAVAGCWRVRIEKRIPVAAGLGGGSSDAAAALRLANDSLARPLPPPVLHRLAASLGADVPFFLTEGSQLGRGDGTLLTPIALPRDYHVVLLLPDGARKESTGAIYGAFDERSGAHGFAERRDRLLAALSSVRTATDLAALPRNDLVSSAAADALARLGAFRADVTGAGPAVYGLFATADLARHAALEAAGLGRTWVAAPTGATVSP